MIPWIIAGVVGLWAVGRISRRSPHHPINFVPHLVAKANVSGTPQTSSSEETAQIPGGLVAGDGGGE